MDVKRDETACSITVKMRLGRKDSGDWRIAQYGGLKIEWSLFSSGFSRFSSGRRRAYKYM